MRKKIIIFPIIIILFIAFFIFRSLNSTSKAPENNLEPTVPPLTSETVPTEEEREAITVVAEGLDTPWALAFLPDGSFLITERPGRVRLVTSNGQLQEEPVAVLEKVKEIGEGGLLGIALHPDFANNHFVYLYYTFQGEAGETLNRVVRMTLENMKLQAEEVIVDNIPGAANHNGGRIKFGPDNYLYITTGDAQETTQSQEVNSLGGKILRITDEGQPAMGNPFNNLVYSYGHRNSQGLAWDKQGRLWATEHGRSGALSGLDEINLVESGKNYGWPIIQGEETQAGMERPAFNSGPSNTWAPAAATFFNNSLFFTGLRGQALYELVMNEGEMILKEHFKQQFGRIREIVLGPDNYLYIGTSNQDGRGNPEASDDRIIKIDPTKL